MVKSELLKEGSVIRHWSDQKNKGLLQVETGFEYKEAFDVNPCRYTYKEIDMPEPEKEVTPEELEAMIEGAMTV